MRAEKACPAPSSKVHAQPYGASYVSKSFWGQTKPTQAELFSNLVALLFPNHRFLKTAEMVSASAARSRLPHAQGVRMHSELATD